MAIYIIVTYTGLDAGYDLDRTVTTMLWWSMVEAGQSLLRVASRLDLHQSPGTLQPPMSPPPSSPSLFTVQPAILPTDWPALFAAYWASWASPLQAVAELTLPYIGTGTDRESASFEHLKQRYLADALAHPHRIHWVKCVDGRSGEIIGGGCYEIYRWNPWRAGRKELENPILFEIEEKGIAALSKAMYGCFLEERLRMMSEAHGYGTALFMLPSHRSQGAGQSVFDYIMTKWDELNLEGYMEGTALSTPIALEHGFVRIKELDLGAVVCQHSTYGEGDKRGCGQNVNANVNRVIEALDRETVRLLWRPKKGKKYVDGVTVLPWEGGPRRLSKL
ncbi:hypothetical protein BDW71DRAFT_211986 [Aspergillus fruticulosus]